MLRRGLARNPELGGEEFWAQATIGKLLTDLEIPHERIGLNRIAKVGDPGPGRPAIFVRGELDALPLQGPDGTQGAAHLCGHDVHAAAAFVMTAAANELDRSGKLPFSLVIGFQTSEEVQLISGARQMVASHRLQDLGVGAGVAVHVVGDRPFGTVTADPGMVNAAVYQLNAGFIGERGHGGYPRPADRAHALDAIRRRDGPDAAWRAATADEWGTSVIPAADQFKLEAAEELQAWFGDTAVVNVGEYLVPGVANVIPGRADVALGIRFLSEDAGQRLQALRLVRDLAEEAAGDWWCRRTFEVSGLPPVVNDRGIAAFAQRLLPQAGFRLGAERRTKGGDDFALYGASPDEGGLGIPTLYASAGLKGAPGWEREANLHQDDFRAPRQATGLVARALVPLYFAAGQRLAMLG